MTNIMLQPMDQLHQSDYTKAGQRVCVGRSKLGGFLVVNKSASTIYLQVFDVAGADVAAMATAANAIVDAGTGKYLELPVYAGSYCPAAYSGGKRFHNGIYLRAVTAPQGKTAIAGDDAKYDVDYMNCW
jgi:hypothetical protein